MLGIYEISTRRIAYDTGLTEKEVETIFKAFDGFGKAFFWFGKIFLPNWIRNQAMNDNMMKGALNEYNKLHNDFIIKLKENGFDGFESLSKGCGTLPKKEKEKESEIEGEIEDEKYNEFIDLFNRITGKHFTGTMKDRGQFNARIKEGVTLGDLELAIRNCKADKHHIENPQHLTPEFITRPDKLQKFLNAKPVGTEPVLSA